MSNLSPVGKKNMKKTVTILLGAQFLTKQTILDIQANAKKQGYDEIAFTAEPLVGPYLTIGVDEEYKK